ncbi:carbohydrate-binding protein [Spirosoma sp.]|uniref:carbohydrate-binding protein n=1 Tax=Spirosoma sp. TaxID=1899569 RepID=UPI00260325B7|nr:carbohydrate-binding protein [Spirosoma sp.]MCX6215787.1 carbohydrate-binding protein [Spirosoma sp.]
MKNYGFYLLFVLVLLTNYSVAQSFTHPGILHDESDFERIKAKIGANQEPWISAYNTFKADGASSKNYVRRGPADSVQRDKNGLRNYTIFIRDASAAYQNAIMWKLTGDPAHAEKAIELMNAWSSTLKVMYGSDIQLGAGQVGFRWVNAAEIIRYTYSGWAQTDIARFETMLKTIFVPLIDEDADANWGGGCLKAMMGIGIFCNDSAIYNFAVNGFYNFPCSGLTKIIAPSGQNSESGRDQIHAQVNIGHLAEVAWTAQHQGLDLFGASDNRILSGFEYTAKYLLGYDDVPWDASVHRCTMGPWSKITATNRSTPELLPMYEMVYNYYTKRKGIPAPFTAMAAAQTRIETKGAVNYDGEHLIGWGTLMYSLESPTTLTSQTISFPPLSRKRFGDADFDPGATASSGLPVVYSSADPSVATIVNNKIHIVSAGTVVITAYQTGNGTYAIAPKASQTLSLVFNPYETVQAEDFTIQSGIIAQSTNDTGGGGAITSSGNGSWSAYTGAKLGNSGATIFYIRYATAAPDASLRIRLDGANGPLIGKMALPATGGSDSWRTDSCALNGPIGVHDIYLYLNGSPRVNWFKLDSVKILPPTATLPVNRLEAEDYSVMNAITAGGTEADGLTRSIGNVKSGSWVCFKNIDLRGLYKFEARAASNSSAGSTISKNIEVRLDGVNGPLVATLVVPKTGGWANYTLVNANVSNLSGVHTLYFKFTATGGSYTSFLFNVDWFQLYYNTQTIAFAPLPIKKAGDSDFDPAATTTSNLVISYASSNTTVATIIDGKVHALTPGVSVITASQPGNEVYAAAVPVSQTLTVTSPLQIQYQNGDNGQLTNNTIKPNLMLVNQGATPVPYSELTIRYWLTAENYAGINTWVDYAALGTSKVRMAYVALEQPRQGAYGYVEYSFDASAGNLEAVSNSGSIQSRLANTNWNNFNEADDYSYTASASYVTTDRITLYRNGVLWWGNEPATVAPSMKLSLYSENKNTNTTSNTISTFLKINNDGNVPLTYKDLSVRYWFTADGTQSLNYWIDYAQVGSANLTGQFVRSQGRTNADAYFELKMKPVLGLLQPGSSTGNIQYRITKADWSSFTETNDYSWTASAPFALNPHITVYYKGQLISGVEPVEVSAAGRLAAQSTESPLQVTVLGNPVLGDKAEVEIRGAAGQELYLDMADAQGRLLVHHHVQQAASTERQSVALPHQGVYLLRISTLQGDKIIKLIKP